MASKAGYFNNGSCFLIYQSGARLFTEMVHSYLPKWCILNYRFWCIVIYRSQKPTVTEIKSQSRGLFGILEAYDRSIWFGAGDGVHRYDGSTITDFKGKAVQK
jgi:hypothetical protein